MPTINIAQSLNDLMAMKMNESRPRPNRSWTSALYRCVQTALTTIIKISDEEIAFEKWSIPQSSAET